MSKDRELLELAAKAAGIAGEYDESMNVIKRLPAKATAYGPAHSFWNPLADDGDALRLAVKLGMSVDVCFGVTVAETEDGMPQGENFMHSDCYAATRRAIVRAAAAEPQRKVVDGIVSF